MTLQDTFGYGFVNYFAGLGKKPNTSELLSSNCDYRVEKFGYKIPGGKEIREFFELDEIETKLPEWASELTEAQQAVLEPPYIYHHPLVEDDGETVIRPRREGE